MLIKHENFQRKKLKQEALKKLLNGTEGGNKLGTGESSNSSHLRDGINNFYLLIYFCN